MLTEEKLDDIGARLDHATQLLSLDPIKQQLFTPCSFMIQIVGLFFAFGFCSLALKMR
jgi:hypothetical protein